MRAYPITTFGLENLKLAEFSDPHPGPGEVLVRIRAVSLNYRDLRMVEGAYNPKMKLPRIPCSDGAGEIVALGEGVSTWKTGDRVMGSFFQSWIDGRLTPAKAQTALGGDIDGTLSELAVFKAEGLVRIPDHLTYEEAATLPCAALTAWHALAEIGQTLPGETVLVQGTGGVSVFALQFAKLMGARVLVTSSSDKKLDHAGQLGADALLNYKTNSAWADWTKSQTGGEGADLVIEVGGAGTLPESLKAVRMGGAVAMIGVLSGVEQPLKIAPILHKEIRIQGIYVGSRAMFERMVRALANARMHPVIDRVYPFGEARAALEWMKSGSHFGKIVIGVE